MQLPKACRLDLTPTAGSAGKKSLARVLRLPLRTLVVAIPDCENETAAVQASLRFAGVVNRKGEIRERACGVQIVQTGDLIHKQAPDASVIRYWARLRAATKRVGGGLHLVAGNHELELWRRLQRGEQFGLKRTQVAALKAHIRSTKLFHVDGSTLYLHGLPTLAFLQDLKRYRERTGRKLEHYNRDRFRQALQHPKHLARYAYVRGARPADCLLHDVQNPNTYFRRNGREVAALLGKLGIVTVVHGHRPERNGVQKDFEHARWLPGVRLISGDVHLDRYGLGATVIRQPRSGPADVLFVNKVNAKASYRKLVEPIVLQAGR